MIRPESPLQSRWSGVFIHVDNLQTFDPNDDVIRRCARNKYAGSFPVVRVNGEILNDHKRVAAARRAGLESHPVEVVDVTDEQAHELYRIAHRSHEGGSDGEQGEAGDTDGEGDI